MLTGNEQEQKRLHSLQGINQRNIDDYFADGKALSEAEVSTLLKLCTGKIAPAKLVGLQHFLKVINPSSVAVV